MVSHTALSPLTAKMRSSAALQLPGYSSTSVSSFGFEACSVGELLKMLRVIFLTWIKMTHFLKRFVHLRWDLISRHKRYIKPLPEPTPLVLININLKLHKGSFSTRNYFILSPPALLPSKKPHSFHYIWDTRTPGLCSKVIYKLSSYPEWLAK